MDDWDWLKAVPIGIVFFASTILAATRRKAGRALAQREYPALAERLHLTREPPRYAGWAGKLAGHYEGRRVVVEPDEHSRLLMEFRMPLGVDLRSYERWKRDPPGLQGFSLGKELDAWLDNRFCLEDKVEAMRNNAELAGLLQELRDATERLKEFTVDETKIECVVEFGSPPYIPARVVERCLPVLSRLAALLESIVPRSQQVVEDHRGASQAQPGLIDSTSP